MTSRQGIPPARTAPHLGEYLDLDSPVHRVPALVKMSVVLGLLVAAALAERRLLLGALLGISLGGAVAARMPWSLARRLAIGLVFFGVVTTVAQLLLGGEGGLAGLHSPAEVAGRVVSAIRACVRAAIAVLTLATLTLTTPPLEAAEQLDRLFARRRGRRPRGGFALALLLAFRFLPLVADELARLRRARLARGAARQMSRGWSLPQEWREVFPAFLAALLRRADEVALALEARGFR